MLLEAFPLHQRQELNFTPPRYFFLKLNFYLFVGLL